MKYYPELAMFFSSPEAAIYYMHIWNLRDKGKRSDGFIYKSKKEFTTETGLNRYQQDKARAMLVSRGWLETKRTKAYGAVVLHFKPIMGLAFKDKKGKKVSSLNSLPSTNRQSSPSANRKAQGEPILNNRNSLDNSIKRESLINKLSM